MPRMTYETIQKQIQKLQAQAKKLEANHLTKKSKSIVQVKTLMKKLGISLEDLSHATTTKLAKVEFTNEGTKKHKLISKRPRVAVAPKYRHPTTNETWTGRGKPPKWLAAEIANGHRKEDFLINTGGSGLLEPSMDDTKAVPQPVL